MKKSIHIVQLVLLGALLIQASGCTTSRSLMKDGIEYSEAGMHQEAVNAFKASLEKKYQNVDSRMGLKTSGQLVLDGMLQDFSALDAQAKMREAVYAYRASIQFMQEAKDFGVDLDINEEYTTRYQAAKEVYVSGLYDDGIALLNQEDFRGAQLRFDEVLILSPGYRDVDQLQNMSILEPRYRQAMGYMNQGYYRAAYWQLRSISDEDSNYRDVAAQQSNALQYGEFTMAILPFENSCYVPFIEQRIEAYTLNSLIDLRNPFLKIVDRQNLDVILAEQGFNLSGHINSATAVEVGNLTGADAILLGQVIDFIVNPGQGHRIAVPAFESYDITVKGDEGKENVETRYKPVTYFEYSNSNSVYVSFLIKMLDLETSEVLVSEVFERQLGDAVSWAEYEGKYKNLVPDLDGEPCTDKEVVNGLMNLFEERRRLVAIDQIINDAYREISTSVAYRVDDFLR